MKHTKGPWKLEINDNKKEIWAGDHFIATISYDCNYSIKKKGLEDANAALIEAAPEMLEALEQAERVFNVKVIVPIQAFTMIERIKHLINKAKGE